MQRKTSTLVLLLGMSAIGCQGGPSDDAPTMKSRAEHGSVELPAAGASLEDTIVVVMKDGDISPPIIRLRIGRSTVLRVRNEGSTRHELMIGRQPAKGSFLIPFFDDVPAAFSGPVTAAETDAGRRRHERFDSAPATPPDSLHYQLNASLEPGQEAYIAFVPPQSRSGEWQARCVTLDHAESGELAVVIVEREY